MNDVKKILPVLGLDEEFTVLPFGNGLINHTWLVSKAGNGEKFILQGINQNIFTSPGDISFNIRLVADYLKEYKPGYLFISPVKTIDGNDFIKTTEGYFRMFPFLENSHTIDTVQTPEQAYHAAKQFATFTKVLTGIEVSKLKITIPDFHNLSFRFKIFEDALEYGNKSRIRYCESLINVINGYKDIVHGFEKIKLNNDFKIRVMHHDTKISNVLLDNNDNGLCVIDLDTVMPGYFISDVGDMIRTYLCPVSEEEKDFSKIEIRDDFFNAIKEGYLSEMNNELTQLEKEHFIYAGKCMIYMQALRFLTDFINNDVYYGAKYEGHNFVRAGNQLTLLQKLYEFETQYPSLQSVDK